jgi:hypothetical protein
MLLSRSAHGQLDANSLIEQRFINVVLHRHSHTLTVVNHLEIPVTFLGLQNVEHDQTARVGVTVGVVEEVQQHTCELVLIIVDAPGIVPALTTVDLLVDEDLELDLLGTTLELDQILDLSEQSCDADTRHIQLQRVLFEPNEIEHVLDKVQLQFRVQQAGLDEFRLGMGRQRFVLVGFLRYD